MPLGLSARKRSCASASNSLAASGGSGFGSSGCCGNRGGGLVGGSRTSTEEDMALCEETVFAAAVLSAVESLDWLIAGIYDVQQFGGKCMQYKCNNGKKREGYCSVPQFYQFSGVQSGGITHPCTLPTSSFLHTHRQMGLSRANLSHYRMRNDVCVVVGWAVPT
jgi:hypothetical protein